MTPEGNQPATYAEDRPKLSSRDYDVVHDRLESWLASSRPGPKPTVSGAGRSPRPTACRARRAVRRRVARRRRTAARGRSSPGWRPSRRRAGVPRLRPRPPVPGHADRSASARRCPCRRRCGSSPTRRRVGAPFFVMERVDGRRAARRPALQLRRQLAVRRLARGPAPPAGDVGRRARRHPRRRPTRRRSAFLEPRPARRHRRCAATSPTSGPTTAGSWRDLPVAAARAGLRLAARTTGPTTRARRC